MLESYHDKIEEMFIVKTKHIQLIGSLIRETPKRFSTKGTVNFADGTFWAFESPGGERWVVRRKLEDMFEKAAAFYDTEVIVRCF